AARTYFDKEATGLTAAEAALLAGLVQAPGRYRPFEDPGPARERRAHVLRRMAAAGHISAEEGERFAESPLNLRSPEPIHVGGHFVEYVRRQLENMFGNDRLYRGGLRVYTSLSLKDQEAAEEAVSKGIQKLVRRRWRKEAKDPEWKGPEGALLAMDPRTGAIRAMVGGLDFQKSKFNRAIQAFRQPGSAFKPVVYAAAIKSGFTPVDAILDAPLVLDGGAGQPAWKPRNYARDFRGRLSLMDALAASRNTVSVRLVRSVGIKRVIDFARLLRIKSPISPTMASALGSSVTTLGEIVSAYSVFANLGLYSQPFAIRRVEDSQGEVLFEHEAELTEAIRPGIAYVVTHMLRGVVEWGTARGVRVLGRPIAGKTGTTNNFRDNWFIGYSPQLVAGVWVGFDLPRSLGYAETGGKNAVPIFVDFFRKALEGKPIADFSPPPGVEFVRIDPATGLLASRSSRKSKFEAFIRGTAPTQYTGSEKIRPDAIFRVGEQKSPSRSTLAR
ncbi:MAG: penicillin-binding transpeptidase domain-containing protein, partial [bacterium]